MRVLRRCIAPFLALAVLASADAAAAATYYVSPSGSDSATGTDAAPFRTIGKAAQVARSGDQVLVASGSYPETVTIPASANGATFRGEGATRPIVAGDGVRPRGFVMNSARGVTIEGFEVTGQTETGIYVNGYDTTVRDNLVHHIGDPGATYATGIKVFYGAGSEIAANTVHSIGPGSESFGVWLLETRDAAVDGNTIYLVRKEGIRDWKGLDNDIASNRVFLTWAGISLNTSTGSQVVNNYAYDNAIGIVVKHTSYPSVLNYWGLAEGRWSNIRHNTVWRSTGSSIALGQSDEPTDYVDVSDNVFDDAGLAYIHDFPALRGPNVVVDGNAYAPPEGGRPRYVYKAGWSSDPGTDWSGYRAQLGWDARGSVLDPQLSDPDAGNLDYGAGSPAAAGSIDLGGAYGSQLGARGLPAASTTWTPYPMQAIDSSSRGTWSTTRHLQDTADNDQYSYWLSSTNQDEFVTYDFGQQRTFDLLVLTVFSHFDKRNIRGYRFETSDDLENWTTVLEGRNPDAAGSSYKYELPAPATGRYLRFRMLDTFCASYQPRTNCGEHFVFSDLRVGRLNAPPSPPRPPQVDVSIPKQSLSRVVDSNRLIARIRCSERCRIASALHGRAGGARMGRAKAKLRAGVRSTVRIRLRPAARRKLARERNVKLTLRTTARNDAAAKASAGTKVRLRR